MTIVPSPCGQRTVNDSLAISSHEFKPSVQRQRPEAGLDLPKLPFRLEQNRSKSRLWVAAIDFSSLKPSHFLDFFPVRPTSCIVFPLLFHSVPNPLLTAMPPVAD